MFIKHNSKNFTNNPKTQNQPDLLCPRTVSGISLSCLCCPTPHTAESESQSRSTSPPEMQPIHTVFPPLKQKELKFYPEDPILRASISNDIQEKIKYLHDNDVLAGSRTH